MLSKIVLSNLFPYEGDTVRRAVERITDNQWLLKMKKNVIDTVVDISFAMCVW